MFNMKKTLGCIRKTDQDFSLISPGDRIAIGVSGGKDSLLLLHALSLYRLFSHKDFSILAVTVTLGLEPFDLSPVRALCDRLGIEYVLTTPSSTKTRATNELLIGTFDAFVTLKRT